MRIDTLTVQNAQTQGARRREALNRQSPQHLTNATKLMQDAIKQRPYSASHSTVILGAGACTEVPLAALVHHSDEVVLADLDQVSMQQARAELAQAGLRKAVRLVVADLSGGISSGLERLLARQPWQRLTTQGARAIYDAAAACLDEFPVPEPQIAELPAGNFGVVISSLLLTQLFSYPLLDILDRVQKIAPAALEEQERHHRYQEAARTFRERVIQAHLRLMSTLLDENGVAVLICDQRGFVFDADDPDQHRSIPLVPRAFPELLANQFTIAEEREWEWLTDLPTEGRYGRGYEISGYLLR